MVVVRYLGRLTAPALPTAFGANVLMADSGHLTATQRNQHDGHRTADYNLDEIHVVIVEAREHNLVHETGRYVERSQLFGGVVK